MKKYYFYCPKCGREITSEHPISDALAGIQTSFGMKLYYIPCENCGNPKAAYIEDNMPQSGKLEDKVLYRSIISLYGEINVVADSDKSNVEQEGA